jgi:Carboxypeptidase regulatory-like domain
MIKRLFLIMLLASGVQAQAPASRPLPHTASGYQISGTVVNATGGQILSGIDVSISSVNERDAAVHSLTGQDGQFSFPNVPAGKYALQAHGRGFADQAYKEHDGFSTAIAVGPGLDATKLVFPLNPDAGISGLITDEQNETVRDGQVMLFHTSLVAGRPDTHMEQQSAIDDEGRFRFSHLGQGTYYVAVLAQPWYAQHPSRVRPQQPAEGVPQAVKNNAELDVAYPTTYYGGSTEWTDATPITLRPGDRFNADIQLRPVPAAHLVFHRAGLKSEAQSGEVVVAPNLSQMIFEDYRSYISGNATTYSGTDAMEISGVAPGHYLISVSSPDGKSTREQEMDVTGDSEVSLEEIGGAPVNITGTVHVEGDDPPDSFRSLIFHTGDSGATFVTQISAKGEFETQHTLTKPTNLELSVFNNSSLFVSSVSATGAKVTGQHNIQVYPGASVKLNVIMSRGLGQVDGVVLHDGKPLAEAMVLLVPQDAQNNSGRFRRDQSDSDGTFTLPSVTPGPYTVVAIQNGWDLQWSDPAVIKPYLANGELVQVRANENPKIKVKAQAVIETATK